MSNQKNSQIGYSPIGFVRCGRSACRIAKMNWKIGKETGGKKMEDPHSLKSNEMAEVTHGLAILRRDSTAAIRETVHKTQKRL